MDELRETLSRCLPQAAREGFDVIPQAVWADARELRMRCEGAITLIGRETETQVMAHMPRPELYQALQALSGYTLSMRRGTMSQGYFTLRGGHRVGVCGQVAVGEDGQATLCEISGVCVRLARTLDGAAEQAMGYVCPDLRPVSALILGAPGTGKTTLLRALARRLSDEKRLRVGIADERSEIAACQGGVPDLPVGMRTDVLDGLRKAKGLRWLLRAMQPDVLMTDEIALEEDACALLDMLRCGVPVICTAHASSLRDFEARAGIGKLWRSGLFAVALELSDRRDGRIARVRTWEEWTCKP